MRKTLFGNGARKIKPYSARKGVIKPVLQIKNGVIVGRFESISEAGRRTNILSTSISSVCRGKNKTTGGYAWKYAEYDMPKVKKNKHGKCNVKTTAIMKQKKGPFKIVITELCNSEQEAKTLLKALAIGEKSVNPKNARIIQTRNRKK